MTLTRKDVSKMIGERIAQSIVLANHLSDGGEPFESYVKEKTNSWPALDQNSKEIFHAITIVLESEYGIKISTSPYG